MVGWVKKPCSTISALNKNDALSFVAAKLKDFPGMKKGNLLSSFKYFQLVLSLCQPCYTDKNLAMPLPLCRKCIQIWFGIPCLVRAKRVRNLLLMFEHGQCVVKCVIIVEGDACEFYDDLVGRRWLHWTDPHAVQENLSCFSFEFLDGITVVQCDLVLLFSGFISSSFTYFDNVCSVTSMAMSIV